MGPSWLPGAVFAVALWLVWLRVPQPERGAGLTARGLLNAALMTGFVIVMFGLPAAVRWTLLAAIVLGSSASARARRCSDGVGWPALHLLLILCSGARRYPVSTTPQ